MTASAESPRAVLERLREDYLSTVRKLRDERADVEARLGDAEAQLRGIEAALSAMKGEAASPRAGLKLTIKEGVLKILGRIAPRGLTALEILERLRTEFEMDYERTSLSPQLSRLKGEGKIRLERGVWFVTRNQNGSEAQAAEPS